MRELAALPYVLALVLVLVTGAVVMAMMSVCRWALMLTRWRLAEALDTVRLLKDENARLQDENRRLKRVQSAFNGETDE